MVIDIFLKNSYKNNDEQFQNMKTNLSICLSLGILFLRIICNPRKGFVKKH